MPGVARGEARRHRRPGSLCRDPPRAARLRPVRTGQQIRRHSRDRTASLPTAQRPALRRHRLEVDPAAARDLDRPAADAGADVLRFDARQVRDPWRPCPVPRESTRPARLLADGAGRQLRRNGSRCVAGVPVPVRSRERRRGLEVVARGARDLEGAGADGSRYVLHRVDGACRRLGVSGPVPRDPPCATRILARSPERHVRCVWGCRVEAFPGALWVGVDRGCRHLHAGPVGHLSRRRRSRGDVQDAFRRQVGEHGERRSLRRESTRAARLPASTGRTTCSTPRRRRRCASSST